MSLKTGRYQTVYMADHEWQPKHDMRAIAQEVFSQDADPETLFLEVREHAGWWMAFGMLDGELFCFGSASCGNRESPKVIAWHNRTGDIKWIPSIRRQELQAV